MVELLRKYANEHSRFLVVDGAMIHYRDEGEGFPLVLLHGAFSSLHTFDAWTEQLRDTFRVIRYDLPGFGLTGPTPEQQYSMPRHLYYLETILDRLGVEECYLAGSSLGGWIAWEFALRHPERVRKLILIAAAGFLDERSIPLPFKLARVPFANHTIRYVVRRQVLEYFLREVYADPSRITPRLVDRYFDLFTREGNPEAFVRLVNGRVKDNTRHLREIRCPTLIQWGREDRWQPLENAYRFHREIPDTHLIIYEGVGHVPMEESPLITARDARQFLRTPIRKVG